MTVRVERAQTYQVATTAGVAVAGCLALAARPTMWWPAFAITLAVGAAGAAAPAMSLVRGDERQGSLVWLVVTALGVGAFASIRLAAAVPPSPWSAHAAITVVGAAIAEELFFRRFLYAALLRRGAAVAIVVSALLFALVHIPSYGARVFPIDLAAGLVLSWQRWASGSWTAPAVAHVAANLLTIL